MIIAVSQPTFFPWLGYFDIIKKADVFIFLDNVKVEKSSWQMRNRLKTITNKEDGEVWFRIPTKNIHSDTKINEVIIDNSVNWKHKHKTIFENNYGEKFPDIKFLNKIYDKDWNKLVDFNIEFIEKCCEFLKIKTELKKASSLNAEGKKSNLLLNLCLELSATHYLSTIGAKNYLEKDKNLFKSNDIKIIYHEYKHPIYKQKGKKFISNLSILDLLFNENMNAVNIFNSK
jgi:hypothetical protein